jgi:hypothetical protein
MIAWPASYTETLDFAYVLDTHIRFSNGLLFRLTYIHREHLASYEVDGLGTYFGNACHKKRETTQARSGYTGAGYTGDFGAHIP